MIICKSCKKELPDDVNFCSNCGLKIESHEHIIQLICKSCGGTLNISENDDNMILSCSYCGSKELIRESDNVTIEKIRSQTFLKNKQMEHEFIEQSLENQHQQEEIAKNLKFKKSISAKILILFTAISFICLFFCISEKNTFAAVIAGIQALLYITAWLIGIGFIKSKKHHTRSVVTIISLLLIVPFFYCNSYEVTRTLRFKNFDWNEIVLSDVLPDPGIYEEYTGHFYSNDMSRLSVCISDVSEKQYNDYILLCKEKGFNVDADFDYNFKSYNSDGYKISISHNSYENELEIQLEDPMIAVNLSFDNIEFMKLLPEPPSYKGCIEREDNDTFEVYLAEVTPQKYAQYVADCIASGFNIDYRRYDNLFYGDNSDNYSLDLEYQGYNIMRIRIDKREVQ